MSYISKLFDINELAKTNIQDIGYDYDGEYYDEANYDDFIDALLKDYDNYLVVGLGMNWRGGNGYKITNNKLDCFYRNYDCSQYVTGFSRGGKTLILREHHHDVPLGYGLIVIGITDREKDKLEYLDFEKIIEYAKAKAKKCEYIN